jgi:hypothetical protein
MATPLPLAIVVAELREIHLECVLSLRVMVSPTPQSTDFGKDGLGRSKGFEGIAPSTRPTRFAERRWRPSPAVTCS